VRYTLIILRLSVAYLIRNRLFNSRKELTSDVQYVLSGFKEVAVSRNNVIVQTLTPK